MTNFISSLKKIFFDGSVITLLFILNLLSRIRFFILVRLIISSLFLLAPLGCIYYPIEILPNFFQIIAKALPLVYIFDEARNILLNDHINYENLKKAYLLNLLYLIIGIILFYLSFLRARVKGTLINMGE